MTTPLSQAALLVQQTAASIFARVLEVAAAVGLPVETWRAGDPTRTQFFALAEELEAAGQIQVEYAKGSFLSTAEGEHLTLRAEDVYGVERDEATYATSTVVVDNAGGGLFEIDAGGMTFSNSTTGETFTNQATVTINPLETGVEISVVALVAGSAGTSAEDEIDSIDSPALEGVTVVSSTAAVGADSQSDPGLREECLATLGALSPNGPADAYEFVARNEDLTGIAGVTRAKSDGDNPTGTVTVYVGTDTAGLDGASVTAIQDAINEWAEPLCTLATVASATPVTQAVTVNLTPNHAEAQDALEDALDAYFATVPLGGTLSQSAIASVVHATLRDDLDIPLYSVTVSVTVPASDVTYTSAQFPVRGALTLT